MVEKSHAPADRRSRVLLADDHPGLLGALTRFIEPWYAVVGAVSTGTQALEAAERFDPDVIVIDLNLPDVNGLEVCRRVTGSGRRARVVILTAGADPDVEQRALAMGAFGLVPKHRMASDLLPAIEAALAATARNH